MMSNYLVWDRQPKFLSWKIKTWEHAALFPKSFGITSRVRDSARLLRNEVTAPIYAALAEAEESIFRLTEPFPPFEARLLRETIGLFASEGEEEGVALSMPRIEQKDTIFSKCLSDIVPDWDAKLESALGGSIQDLNLKISSFATLGVPRGAFSVSYGYRIDYSVIEGSHLDRNAVNYRALLMGCRENIWQPGVARDITDSITQHI